MKLIIKSLFCLTLIVPLIAHAEIEDRDGNGGRHNPMNAIMKPFMSFMRPLQRSVHSVGGTLMKGMSGLTSGMQNMFMISVPQHQQIVFWAVVDEQAHFYLRIHVSEAQL